MLQMYKGAINSPETIITNNISNTDTLIYVQDETKVPTDLPNLMVLGTGISAETIKVLSISGLAITVERAFQGTAKTWNAGTTIARNFTEYDYEALKNNVEELADNQGDLATLTTTEKTNLVGAVNELVSQSAQKVSKTGDTMTGNLDVPTINGKTPAYAQTPTFTTVTSGFASGWSGTLKYAKTQDNKIIVKIVYMQKTSDISTSGETVYTIPTLPTDTAISLAIGADASNNLITGSNVAVSISNTGQIAFTNKGSVTAGVKTLYSCGVEAY